MLYHFIEVYYGIYGNARALLERMAHNEISSKWAMAINGKQQVQIKSSVCEAAVMQMMPLARERNWPSYISKFPNLVYAIHKCMRKHGIRLSGRESVWHSSLVQ